MIWLEMLSVPLPFSPDEGIGNSNFLLRFLIFDIKKVIANC